MNLKAATMKATEMFGEHCICEISKGGWPLIRVPGVILGTSPLWEECFIKASRLMEARVQVEQLFSGFGYISYDTEGRVEAGLKMYGENVKIASALTFSTVIERMMETAAGKSAAELDVVLDAVTRRFGSTAKVTLGERQDYVFVRRGEETLGYGKTFKEALQRAIAGDDKSMRSRAQVHSPPHEYKPRPDRKHDALQLAFSIAGAMQNEAEAQRKFALAQVQE